MSSQQRVRRSGVGTVVVALILILIGCYYLLRNTLGVDLPPLDAEQVVPAIAIVIGIALLYRVWRDRDERLTGI
jgi:hypothetical protein